MFNFILEFKSAIRPAPPDSADDGGFSVDEIGQLVARAKKGDDGAFSELVLHYERFVYNAACRTLLSSKCTLDTAEDIAQESFVKAWRSLSQFRGDCAFSTWLYRITVNTARDMIQSDSRRTASSLTQTDGDNSREWDVPVTSGDGVPEENLEKKELILGVRRAIESLPEEQRAVIVMRDLDELSYGEIAEKLGIELGTVKSRLNRGRAMLKQIIENGNFI